MERDKHRSLQIFQSDPSHQFESRSRGYSHKISSTSPFFNPYGGKDDIERRTGYALANALRPKREGTLFEHFLVVGVSPNTISKATIQSPEKHKPEVLYQWPSKEKKPLPPFVANFCFPMGVKIECHNRTQSSSNRLELMFGQLSRVEQTDASFIFLITGDQHLLYGICVSQLELLEETLSFADGSKSERVEDDIVTRNRVDYFAPKCYCLISRFPFFSVHFEVIYSLLARERLNRLARAVGVKDEDLKTENSGSESRELLKAYYSIQVPTEHKPLKFNLPGELRSVEFSCLPGDEDKQVANWGLTTLFRLLSLENILLLFRALMIEAQIVVISKNLGLLSAATLSLIPILRPYVFQGPFIPILPEDFIDYLDAPVPYVIGVVDFPISKKYLRPEKFIINIDTNEVSQPDGGIPELPEPNRLRAPLAELHKSLTQPKKTPNPYQDMSKDLQIISGIVGAFKQYQCWLMDDVIIRHVDISSKGESKSLSDFDFGSEKMKELVQIMPESYQKFMTPFLSAQQFSSYSDKLLEIIHKKGIIKLHRGDRSHSSDSITVPIRRHTFGTKAIQASASGSPPLLNSSSVANLN